ncbi:MAG TPA: mechanosensitive ion channel family protein [Bryobacteraceae bacterium]|jgi:MscS family membrane protein|nr:mechanosensitive ion channel family protein [Bryobacteraceae bacterium]
MRLLLTLLLATVPLFAQPATKPDPLGRDNPRSTVTNFLEACQARDFTRAAQYLDLSAIPQNQRAQRGPDLARKLEGALNDDPHFSVFRLSRDPLGDQSDDTDPNREHVANATEAGKPITLDLAYITPPHAAGAIWVFSADTVLVLPRIAGSSTSSAIARNLPPFFSNIQILETPLWKWIALLLCVLVLISIAKLLDRFISGILRLTAGGLHLDRHMEWIRAVLAPVRVLICLLLFRMFLEIIGLAAIARLFVGRMAGALFVCSFAWGLMRLVGIGLRRVESRMDQARRASSRSVLYLGRRTINATIGILAVLLILSNWGYNTATLIAGLGVGGIAIALAAQQTIANIFGGVSVIADHPVRIGEYGKFGDLFGTLEDIGLRSTRIRTLSRTVVSVPNSTFAGYNLENYASRDKILFNPTLALKRGAGEQSISAAIEAVRKLLSAHKDVESPPAPVRIVGLTASAVNMEIFCYVRTTDLDRFYTIQGQLLLAIDQALAEAKVELA